jgi:hypothetical protein
MPYLQDVGLCRRCRKAKLASLAGANRVIVLDTSSGLLRVANGLSNSDERGRWRGGPVHRYGIHGIRTISGDATGGEGALSLCLGDYCRFSLPLRVSETAQYKGQRPFESQEDDADDDERDQRFDKCESGPLCWTTI